MRNRLRFIWEVFILITVFITGMLVPMVLALGAEGFTTIFILFAALYLFDLLYVIRLRPRLTQAELVHHFERLEESNTPWWGLDLLAFLSMAASAVIVTTAHGPSADWIILASLIPLAKLYKLNSLFDDLQNNLTLNPSILRLGIFIFWIFLAAHLMALGWIMIGAVDPALDNVHAYATALYWSVTTLTTVGYGDITPDLAILPQIFFTIIVMFLGVGMYGYIIGSVATLIANLDMAKARRLEKMEEVNSFLKSREVPDHLQERVRSYYRYLWERHKSTTMGSFLKELPHTLEVDLALFLYQNILEKVPYFSDADELFIREIVQRMELLVFLPGDYIIRQGEFGEAMYFLSSGKVEVIIDGEFVATREAGSFFGESSLIRNEARNASIGALSFCDVYRLSKHDFDDLRQRYTEFDEHVKDIQHAREER